MLLLGPPAVSRSHDKVPPLENKKEKFFLFSPLGHGFGVYITAVHSRLLLL
jgi:hypothetical protein